MVIIKKIKINTIYEGDCLEVLKSFPNECVDMVITSPPYYRLRDYGVEKQLGLETTFQEYIDKLIVIFKEVKRVLKTNGSCYVNISDTYFGKSLIQIPSRFAISMIDNGWVLRNEIIWHKPNAMPSSVKDRFTVDYEKLFFFTKSKKYYFKQQKEPMKTTDVNPPKGSKGVIGQLNKGLRKQDLVGRNDYTGFNNRYVAPKDLMRNKRSVWTISTQPLRELHFATFPEKLIETPIKASCPEGGIVLDIFMGSGTTGVVAKKLNRNYVGIEINNSYIKIAEKRIRKINNKQPTLF